MKIGQQPDLQTLAQTASKQAKAATAPAAEATNKAATSAAAGVPVTFSNTARALDQTQRASGDFDANRVKAVRAAIEQGTFKINAEAIADKLLANAQEVLGHSRS